jgi:CBS domain-containing protein
MRPVNLTISPDTDVMELRRVMIDTHVRYVPVVREGVLEGVLSLYDVAKAVLEEQSFENRMLKAYIRDWPEPEPVRG